MAQLSFAERLRSRLRAQVAAPFERHVRAPLRRLRNAGRTYRPLFVTGVSGSGTSLLAVSLGQRLDCAGLVYECDDQISHGSFLYVPTLARFGSVAEYERFIAPRDDWSVSRGREDVQAMLRAYATAPGDTVVAKGPDIHLARAGFLHRCFPEASFLVIFRDPVANVEGLRRKWRVFGEDSVEECIRFYREIHERFLEVAAGFGERSLLVDYADLVERTDETLAALAEQLGLAPARRALTVPDAPNAEGKGIRNVRAGRVQIVTDADRRARARLAPDEAAAIQEALAPLQEQLRRAAITPGQGAEQRCPRPGARPLQAL